MIKCASFNLNFLDTDRFIGCDGKVLSNDLIKGQLKQFEDSENYEECIILRKELVRRMGLVAAIKFLE